MSFSSQSLRKQTVKDTMFTWNEDCEREFQQITQIIGNLSFILPFTKDRPLEMYGDASKEGGLAYLLVQVEEDRSKAVIQCGSTSLTENQSRYSITDLEMLADLRWLTKCSFYLKGAPHNTVYSNHLALAGLCK